MKQMYVMGGGGQLFTNCTHNPKCEGGERYLISNTFGDNL